MGEEREVLTAPALLGGLILDQFQLKFKANQELGSITEAAAMKAKETNKIRDICRAICEIPENRAKSNRERIKKLKTNGKLWAQFKK